MVEEGRGQQDEDADPWHHANERVHKDLLLARELLPRLIIWLNF